jgi:hypothetical protein
MPAALPAGEHDAALLDAAGVPIECSSLGIRLNQAIHDATLYRDRHD